MARFPGVSVSILGHSVQRSEDPSLLTGLARFTDDLDSEGVLRAHFVRSQVPHARIIGIDTSEARTAPGVVGVFAASDLSLPPLAEGVLGSSQPRAALSRPVLATDRVRFVGEAVAVVVAETTAQAVDAAELVRIDLEELEAVTDPWEALAGKGALLFSDHGSNLVLDIPPEDPSDVLEGSDLVVSCRFVNQRVAPSPMEGNAIQVSPTQEGGLTVWVSTQSAFRVRDAICASLGLGVDQVRVIAPAVGGGFGAKGGTYPEHVVVAGVARRLGRPLRWIENRSENLVSMTHGRGQLQEVELGAKRDGTLVGLRARTVNDVGAYPWRGALSARTTRLMGQGVYRIPKLSIRSMAVVTNKTPTGPYRGAGRPEATAMIERSMDLLAAELDLDPAELRRRNFLRPEEFPLRTLTGASYDSGEYLKALEEALSVAHYDELRVEQKARRASDSTKALGIGISSFVEVSGSGSELGGVRIASDGSVIVLTGSSPHGQGHETTFAQVAASVLSVPFESVKVVHSDTALVPRGVGTFGSRSGQLAGSAVFQAGQAVLEKARTLAANLFEASVEDVVQADDGSFSVAGVPSARLTWAELAAAAEGDGLPEGIEPGLSEEVDFAQPESTYPFGTHVAVVEVDTETGWVELRHLVAVDDAGSVLNPMIVAGQVHGGLAQGVAQALFEEAAYDEAGNPLTATLADYAFPSAADLPSWELSHTTTPSPRNPLGMKGVGESGTVGATVAVQNAVLDALRPYGVRHLDMPLSPSRVWGALRAAAGGSGVPSRSSDALGGEGA